MQEARDRPNTQPPDVGAILDELRAQVRERRLAQGRAAQSPLERDLQRSLDEIELYRVISAHWPLLGATLPQRAIMLVNKVVRRYLRWYINPIVEQQNAYNDAVARTLRLLAEAYGELMQQVYDAQSAARDAGGPPGPRPTADTPPQPADALPTDTSALMALVRARAAEEPPARFPDLELDAQEPQLHLRQTVSAHWPLSGATLPQRAVALVNKLVRRYLRWYINPIVEQQNAANAAFTGALAQLIALDAAHRAEVAALRARRTAR